MPIPEAAIKGSARGITIWCRMPKLKRSHILARLEHDRFVRRKSSEIDRRIRSVEITARGRVVAAEIQDAYWSSFEKRLAAELLDADMPWLEGVLRRLESGIDEHD
jgi:DNA-binding MarR family transcriptional regulator